MKTSNHILSSVRLLWIILKSNIDDILFRLFYSLLPSGQLPVRNGFIAQQWYFVSPGLVFKGLILTITISA